jgi:hypothetical protein
MGPCQKELNASGKPLLPPKLHSQFPYDISYKIAKSPTNVFAIVSNLANRLRNSGYTCRKTFRQCRRKRRRKGAAGVRVSE